MNPTGGSGEPTRCGIRQCNHPPAPRRRYPAPRRVSMLFPTRGTLDLPPQVADSTSAILRIALIEFVPDIRFCLGHHLIAAARQIFQQGKLPRRERDLRPFAVTPVRCRIQRQITSGHHNGPSRAAPTHQRPRIAQCKQCPPPTQSSPWVSPILCSQHQNRGPHVPGPQPLDDLIAQKLRQHDV